MLADCPDRQLLAAEMEQLTLGRVVAGFRGRPFLGIKSPILQPQAQTVGYRAAGPRMSTN